MVPEMLGEHQQLSIVPHVLLAAAELVVEFFGWASLQER